jgi:hypothetical protein
MIYDASLDRLRDVRKPGDELDSDRGDILKFFVH